MALAAAQCVTQIAALLVAAGTVAGARVYTNRNWPLSEDDLPALLVHADTETLTAATLEYPWLDAHELEVRVQGYVRATETLDDEINALAEQVLNALFTTQAAAQLSPLVGVEMRCSEIERFATNVGPADAGQAAVTLALRFHTPSNAPQTLV
jgi:hypothetical protein